MSLSELMLPIMFGFSLAMLGYVALYLTAAAVLFIWNRIERRLQGRRAR